MKTYTVNVDEGKLVLDDTTGKIGANGATQGSTAGKNGVAGIAAAAEQGAKVLPHIKGGKGSLGGGTVAGTVDIDANLFNIILHCLSNPRCLGKAGCTVI